MSNYLNNQQCRNQLVQASDLVQQSKKDLAETIVTARDVGNLTWREIAQAVGMTEHGVAAIYRRNKQSS